MTSYRTGPTSIARAGSRPGAAPGTAETPASAVSRHRAEPLYMQLASELARRIAAGEFAPGRRLPTELELMAEHGVSRITVRQAIGLLVRNGRVTTQRGKGTFVNSPTLSHDLGALRGFYDALRDQGFEPQTELLEYDPIAGRTDVNLPPGLDLPVRLRRRYLLDGVPFAIVEAWLPPAAAALDAARAAQVTVYEIVERFIGERIAAADVAIRCQPAAAPIAAELGLAKGNAVLLMERRSENLAGRILEFMRIHIVPERYEFRLRVPGPLEIANSLRQSGAARAASPPAPRRPVRRQARAARPQQSHLEEQG